jgi:hypothetical protein
LTTANLRALDHKQHEIPQRNLFADILNFVASFSHSMTSSTLLSAREIAAQIRRKEVSPMEVARAHLDRIARLNPRLNAFVDYQPEAVLAQAREAETAIRRKNKDELGPLHGVPISIKSSIDVAGHRCEAGTRLRAGHIASEDAPLVARLRAAGAVMRPPRSPRDFPLAASAAMAAVRSASRRTSAASAD